RNGDVALDLLGRLAGILGDDLDERRHRVGVGLDVQLLVAKMPPTISATLSIRTSTRCCRAAPTIACMPSRGVDVRTRCANPPGISYDAIRPTSLPLRLHYLCDVRVLGTVPAVGGRQRGGPTLVSSGLSRFHQPPPSAWKSAAVSVKRAACACTRWRAAC